MNMKKIFLISVLMMGCFTTLMAQQKEGKVEIIQDSLIRVLQEARIHYANTPADADTDIGMEDTHKKGTKSTALGFRVQIYTGPDRDAAYAKQAQFKNLYPDIATYVSYTQPNYRVKVGDFRSRNEANALMAALKKRFSPVFLFTEMVNVYY